MAKGMGTRQVEDVISAIDIPCVIHVTIIKINNYDQLLVNT